LKTHILKIIFSTIIFCCFIGQKGYGQTATFTAVTGGLPASYSTYTAGETKKGLIGFSAVVTGGSITFKQFDMTFSIGSSQSYFANGTLYRSTSASYQPASPGTPVGNVTFNGGTITINNFTESISGITVYYYLVADLINTTSQQAQLVINSGNFATDVNGGTNYSQYGNYQGMNFVPGSPYQVKVSNLTGGLNSNTTPLTPGIIDAALFGFSVTTTNNFSFNSFNIYSNTANLATYFSGFTLYKCAGSSYSATSRTAVGTGTVNGNYITILPTATESVNNSTQYYFLVANTQSSFATVPANIQFNLQSGQAQASLTSSTPTGATYNTSTVFGDNYIANSANITMSSQQNGLTASPVYGGQTNVAIFGFGVTVTGSSNISQFNINSNNAALSTYFGNVRLVSSSTNSYTGTLTTLATGTINGGFINFSGLTQSITNATKYYFLVVDDIYTGTATSSVAFNFTSGQANNAIVQSSPSSSYNFFNVTGSTYALNSPPTPTVAISAQTAGLASTTLAYGQIAGVFGFGVNVTFNPNIASANVTLNKFNISADQNAITLQAMFGATATLYRGTSNTFNPANPGTAVGTVTLNNNDINVTGLTETFTNAQTQYYFLVVNNIYSSYSTTQKVRFYINSAAAAVSSTGTNFSTYSIYENTYTLSTRPITYTVTDANLAANNITQGSLTTGQTNVTMFGFGLGANINATVTAFNIANTYSVGTADSYFTNGKLYRSNSSAFTLSTSTYVTTVAFGTNATGITVSGLTENFVANAAPVYYFIVGDVRSAPYGGLPGTSQFQILSTQTNAIVLSSPASSNITVSTNINGRSFPLVKTYYWSGTGDRYWNNSNNWAGNNVPPNDGTANISITNTTFSPIVQNGSYDSNNGAGVALNVNSLKVDANSKLTFVKNYGLQIGSGGLTIEGTLEFTYSNDGNWPYPNVDGNNTITLAAGSANTVKNIILNKLDKANTVTITSGGGMLNVTGTITPTKGTLVTNGLLTLKSTATATGSIGEINSANTAITGNVTAERYITGGPGYNTTRKNYTYRNYRIMSSPVYTTSVSGKNVSTLTYVANSAIVTGATGGYGPTTANPTLYLFNENFAGTSSSFTSGNFRPITNITSETLTVGGLPNYLYAGTGFLFYFRGNMNNPTTKTTSPYVAPENVVFSNTGVINQGDIDVVGYSGSTTLTKNTLAPASLQGLVLVGNPYPSTIDWEETSGYAPTNISSTIYVFNAVTNQYDTYVRGSGGTSPNENFIASGQAFFIKLTSPTGKFTFKEKAKTSQQLTAGVDLLMSKESLKEEPISQLRLKLAVDSLNYDNVLIALKNGADEKYLETEDGTDLGGSGAFESLSVLSSDKIALAISAVPYPKKQPQIIPLAVNATSSGLLSLSLNNLQNLPAIYQVWLKDDFKKDSLDMRVNKTYNFNVDKNDAATFGNDRFKIIIRQNPAMTLKLLDFAATKVTAGAELSWITENESNYTNFTVERSVDGGKKFDVIGGFLSSQLGKYQLIDKSPVVGMNQYRLKQDDINGTITYSKPVNLMYALSSNSVAVSNLTVFPNPVASTVNVAFTAQKDVSTYNITVTNGVGMYVRSLTTSQTTWQNTVTDLMPGTYFVQVRNNSTKAIVGNNKFIKL
jgi:hypothetical protein